MVALGAALGAAQPAPAQGGPTRPGVCPLDEGRLALAKPTPWNVGGGVDTDGCTYSLDEAGRRSVSDEGRLVVCTRCGAGYPRAQLELRLTAAETRRLRQALASIKSTGPTRRWETAALTLTALGADRLDLDGDMEGLAGEFLLRGAWAARAAAVTPGPSAGYAPLSVEEAREQLEALEQRVTRDPRARPNVVELEQLLTGLEATRKRLGLVQGDALTLSARRSLLRSHSRLGRLERQLLARKASVLAEASGDREQLSESQLREALARAWIRFGTPLRWAPLLKDLGPMGATILEACREEARLLAMAGPLLFEAANRASAPTEKARLLFLSGDCARRRGAAEAWPRLDAAARLAGETEAGRRAASLLGR